MATRPTLCLRFTHVEVLEQEPLGQGAYGTVYKAKCDELICAAKKIFPVLFQYERSEPDREHTHPLRRFESECELLKSIHHPNIIQYLGTYRDPETNAPILLMELMDESLTHFLESSPGDLPYHTQVNLSYDIAQALAFLHSNGIIHRDLSSNNVLLLAGRAKVADFGMSNLANTSRTQMTKCPGTPAFMPPEALDDVPVYTKNIDSFSFGVLIVQIMTKKYPEPTDRFKVINVLNPTNSNLSVRAQVSEVDRREAHISLIDHTHPLLPITLDCLKDGESDRPTSRELCKTLHTFKLTYAYQQSIQENSEQCKDEKIREKEEKLIAKTQEINTKGEEIRVKNEKIVAYEHKITTKTIHLQKTLEHLDCYKHLLRANEAELEKQTLQLKEARAECADRTRQLRELGIQVDKCEEESVHPRHTTSTCTSNAIPQTAQCSPSGKLTLNTEYSTGNPFSPCNNMAVVDSKIYFRSHDEMYAYDTDTKEWSELKSALPVSKGFTIVSVNNILTIVGGEGIVRNSNKLYSYLYGKWLELLPPMSKRWVRPHVLYAKRQRLLIVTECGEFEILNIDTLKWSRVSLPLFWPEKMAVVGDYIYMYYIDKMSTVPSETGIRKQLLTDFVNRPNMEEVQHLLLDSIGCITSFQERLLAIGGVTRHKKENHKSFQNYWNKYDYTPVQNIYEYVPCENEWRIIGQMSKPRSHCLAAALPNNRLIVAEYGSIDIMYTN